MKKLIPLIILSAIFLIPHTALAGTLSDPCFPIVYCPAGQDAYAGSCNPELNSVNGAAPSCSSVNGAAPVGQYWAFSCDAGCYLNSSGSGSVDPCPGGIMVGGKCLIKLNVVDDNVPVTGEKAYKIWDGTTLTEVVHLNTAGCANGQVAVSSSTAASGWTCTDAAWVTGGGKLAIGAASAGAALDVELTAGGGATIGSSTSTATGKYAVSIGDTVVTSGDDATAIGLNLTAESYASVVTGRFNVTNAAYSKTTWVATDPLFVIGNGTDAANPANALTVLKNGTVGIGTATPNSAYKLDVNGIANATQYCMNGSCLTSWPTGDVGWAGVTPAAHDGKYTNGYADADAACAAAFATSRVCTVEEILMLRRLGLLPASIGGDEKAWINGGPPGFNSAANDCGGWKLNTGTADNTWGRYWWFGLNQGWADGCNLTHRFACCK